MVLRPLEGQRVVNLMNAADPEGLWRPGVDYCRALMTLGAELHMWTLTGAPSGLAGVAAEGARTRVLGWPGRCAALRTSRLLHEALAELDPDWVHAHCVQSALHASRAVSRGLKARLLVTHHDSSLRWSRRLMTYPYRRAPACVISLARGSAEATSRWYGYPADRTAVLPLPIDLTRYSPGPPDEALVAEFGLHEAYPIIMWTGRLHRLKGHADLLGAFPGILAKHPAARLVFVGSGDHEATLRRLATRLGVANKVVFTGWRGDIPELLRLSHIFVSPSYREAFCLSVQEAMATARPVVSTRVWSAEDLIDDGVHGLLTPIASPLSLTAAVNRLADDRAFAEALGRAARERAVERWSPEAFTRGLGAIYERLLSSSP